MTMVSSHNTHPGRRTRTYPNCRAPWKLKTHTRNFASLQNHRKRKWTQQPHKTNIGPAQTKYILGTSHSCEPEQFQLILDHAGEWTYQSRVYRRTRSMLKIRCTDVRQTRHNYSQSTETEKAKFQNPFTYNDERNFVERNSVKKISNDLVHPTKSDTSPASASILSELEEREEIAEDVPAPADIPAPAPTPAPTLETVEEQPYTPGSRKSTRKNLGRPASTFSDFYM